MRAGKDEGSEQGQLQQHLRHPPQLSIGSLLSLSAAVALAASPATAAPGAKRMPAAAPATLAAEDAEAASRASVPDAEATLIINMYWRAGKGEGRGQGHVVRSQSGEARGAAAVTPAPAAAEAVAAEDALPAATADAEAALIINVYLGQGETRGGGRGTAFVVNLERLAAPRMSRQPQPQQQLRPKTLRQPQQPRCQTLRQL